MAPEPPLPLADAVRRVAALADQQEQQSFLVRCLTAYAAAPFLSALKAECERIQAAAPARALRLAEGLIRTAELAGLPEHAALGMLAKADALRYHGEYQHSLVWFTRAAEAFRARQDDVGWARTRIGWIVTLHRLGRGEEGLAVVESARAILTEHHQRLRAATLDLNTAVVCAHLGRHQRALALYDRARSTYESLGDQCAVYAAKVMSQKAVLLTQLGDFRGALALHKEARITFERRGEGLLAQQAQQNIAYVYAAQGYVTLALRLYIEVWETLRQAGLPVEAAWAALNIVECYLSLNRFSDALELAEETVAQFERLGTPTEAARARCAGALARAGLGDQDGALALLEQAGKAFADADMRAALGQITLQRALLHLAAAHWRAALDEGAQARAIFDEHGQVVRAAQADLVRARALTVLGDHDAAAELASAALTLASDRDVHSLAPEGCYVLAQVAQARHDLATALAQYDQAVESIEAWQQSLALELRTTFLHDKLAIYEDALACCLEAGNPTQAFCYLERAKSRTLVDYLAANREVRPRPSASANPELVAELARLREEHAWFYRQLYGNGLGAHGAAELPPNEGERLHAAIRDRERRITRLRERLVLDGDGEAITAAVAPTLPRIAPDTLLLEYAFRKDRGLVFVVSATGIGVVPLAATLTEIRRLLERWQMNVQLAARTIAAGGLLAGLARNAVGILSALYQALLQPVEAQLAACTRLVVIPFGPTHAVPFHALHDGRRYLLERCEVSTCPSSSLLALCSDRPRPSDRTALVLAHSDGGRLRHVLHEAERVANLLPGECYLEQAATRSVLAAAGRHAVVHLAAHGEARLDNPTFAHLQLADGQLSMIDVFNLDLGGALVTLSACETGRAVVQGGDEVVGLSRGFLHAGAATVVQSHWQVEDEATAALMERFYLELRAGQTKGAALRAAQRALLSARGDHPYFWAPFHLIGDSGAL